jgi:hypothetical protein
MDIVLARLAAPGNKHKSQRILEKKFGKEHDLDAIYRMMDLVGKKVCNQLTAGLNLGIK